MSLKCTDSPELPLNLELQNVQKCKANAMFDLHNQKDTVVRPTTPHKESSKALCRNMKMRHLL